MQLAKTADVNHHFTYLCANSYISSLVWLKSGLQTSTLLDRLDSDMPERKSGERPLGEKIRINCE